MLILSRKAGDAILIGSEVRVVVIATESGGVRLGIEAPTSVTIMREELVRDITDANVQAEATPKHVTFLEGLRKADDSNPGEEAEGGETADP